MNELANMVALTVSGLTRVVDRLARDGLVERARAEHDRRGQLATLTPAGFDRLAKAYPHHLESVRRRVVDHLKGLDLSAFATAVGSIAAGEPGPALRPRPAGSR
jgi:DNA-binding MarR family transcriptional regulator